MYQNQLNDFLLKKTKRQSLLRDRKYELENLDAELSITKFSRSFKNFYFLVKRLLLIAFALLFIGGGVYYLIMPSELIQNNRTKRNIVKAYEFIFIVDNVRDAYEASAEVLQNVYNEGKTISYLEYKSKIESVIDKRVEDKIHSIIRVLAFIGVLLGLSFLYISRLTKKLKRRNKLISKADSLTQDILRDYQLTIDEEEKELQILKELMKNRTTI